MTEIAFTLRNYSWLDRAREHIGLREISGPKHNAIISAWLQKLGAWWRDDEVPWCGTFVGAMLQAAGLPIPRTYFRALSWLDWGDVCDDAGIYGAVAVLSRKGGGHVAFVTGLSDDRKFVLLLGGNQNNRVCELWYPTERVIGYRKPKGSELEVPPILKPWPLSHNSEA